jgi:hypothetical protein
MRVDIEGVASPGSSPWFARAGKIGAARVRRNGAKGHQESQLARGRPNGADFVALPPSWAIDAA